MEGKNTFDERWEGQAYSGKHHLFVDKIIIVSLYEKVWSFILILDSHFLSSPHGN